MFSNSLYIFALSRTSRMVAVDCVWSRMYPGLRASLGPRQYRSFRRQRRPLAGEPPKITPKHAIAEPKNHSPQHCTVILTLCKLLCQNNSHRTRYLVVWIDLFEMCMSLCGQNVRIQLPLWQYATWQLLMMEWTSKSNTTSVLLLDLPNWNNRHYLQTDY